MSPLGVDVGLGVSEAPGCHDSATGAHLSVQHWLARCLAHREPPSARLGEAQAWSYEDTDSIPMISAKPSPSPSPVPKSHHPGGYLQHVDLGDTHPVCSGKVWTREGQAGRVSVNRALGATRKAGGAGPCGEWAVGWGRGLEEGLGERGGAHEWA